MSWLVKSYDFTSQYMLNMQNHLKNSKMGKIGWNHEFEIVFYDFNKKIIYCNITGFQHSTSTLATVHTTSNIYPNLFFSVLGF